MCCMVRLPYTVELSANANELYSGIGFVYSHGAKQIHVRQKLYY